MNMDKVPTLLNTPKVSLPKSFTGSCLVRSTHNRSQTTMIYTRRNFFFHVKVFTVTDYQRNGLNINGIFSGESHQENQTGCKKTK